MTKVLSYKSQSMKDIDFEPAMGELVQPQEYKSEEILSFKDVNGLKTIENGEIYKKYKISRIIGKGSFGTVRIATHRKTGIKCAIKSISKSKLDFIE